MDFTKTIKRFGGVPFSRHLILDLLKDYKSPNDKISELLKSGQLIALRRGLYTSGTDTESILPEPFLIANHLRGPSYVSLEAALEYWGFIPERSYEISSVTLKSSKKYKTRLGRFSYQKLPTPYYSFGIRSVALTSKQRALIASPEKALCDKIVLTPGINLRSVKQTKSYLCEDLRMEIEMIKTLDWEAIDTWVENAPKKTSLKTLTKMLREL